MTTQEKAKQIATDNLMTYVALENDGGTYEVDSENECYQSAMEMAKWKEGQMIEKAVEWIRTNAKFYLLVGVFDNENFMREFNKAMKED